MGRKPRPKLKYPLVNFPRDKVILRLQDTTPALVMPDGAPARKRPAHVGKAVSILKPQDPIPDPIRGPWVYRIPAYYPPSINPALKGHWSKLANLKKDTADMMGAYARTAGVPLVTYTYRPVRLLFLTVIGWADGRTMPDPDNLLKIFRDAAVMCRLIVDDAVEWCKCREPVVQRGEPAETIIEVADLADTPPVTPEHDPQTRRLLAALLRKGKRRETS